MTTSKSIKPGKGEYPGIPLWGEHCFHEVWEVRHVEVYQLHVTHGSQERNKNKKGAHPSSRKRSASMPHCMATGWLFAIVRCACRCSTLSMLPQLRHPTCEVRGCGIEQAHTKIKYQNIFWSPYSDLYLNVHVPTKISPCFCIIHCI